MTWLYEYDYRKLITINGQPGAGTDYQICLEISNSSDGNFNLEGHSRNFPCDIRFTKNDGRTELDYWIENSTIPYKFWIKITDNLDSNVNFYCYYGSNITVSKSSANDVWNYWDEYQSNPISSFTEIDGITHGYGYKNYFKCDDNLTNRKMRYKIYLDNVTAGNMGIVFVGGSSSRFTQSDWEYVPKDFVCMNINCHAGYGATNTNPLMRFQVCSNEVWKSGTYIAPCPIGAEYFLELDLDSTNSIAVGRIWNTSYTLFLNQTLSTAIPNSISYNCFCHARNDGVIPNNPLTHLSSTNELQSEIYSDIGMVKFQYDWVAVGKFISPEPLFLNAGFEESLNECPDVMFNMTINMYYSK